MKAKVKRYVVIDNKNGYKNTYSAFIWNMAWLTVFALGIIVGCCI